MRADLPPAGSIVHIDFRDGRPQTPRTGGSIRLLQWNIERGYKLPGVIDELRRIDADVIALQELDIGCERSGGVDCVKAISQALGLNCLFFCEFEELRSPLRAPEQQGGGVHGNAILSKFDLEDAALVRHRQSWLHPGRCSAHAVDWNDGGHPRCRTEPRRGERAVLRARVMASQPLLVYCAHLEVFCGVLARLANLADIFNDARFAIDQAQRIAILGDMNTMAHGVARLSPSYSCDRMRFLGHTEGELWQNHVLSVQDPAYTGGKVGRRSPNPALLAWGLPLDVARDALNPGFADPFDARATVTLDNPAYRFWGWSLMAGKLDWVLLRRLAVTGTSVGNHDYALSDHKWLCADVAAR